jgi:hypothetical protein
VNFIEEGATVGRKDQPETLNEFEEWVYYQL